MLCKSHRVFRLLIGLLALLGVGVAFAHGVADRDAAFLEQNGGQAWIVFIYLGAKHMITGYDHLLYLLGVIFFLYRFKDIAVSDLIEVALSVPANLVGGAGALVTDGGFAS